VHVLVVPDFPSVPGTADLSGTDVAEDDTVQLPAPKLEHKIHQI
jgi:hypothetical protein